MAHEWLKCNPAMVFDYIGIMNDDTFFGPDFFGGIVAELKCVAAQNGCLRTFDQQD